MSVLEAEVGSSDWMDTIHFRDGKMCFSDQPQDLHHMPAALVPSDLVVVSLGCYCGVKLSFRKLGLESATLPLDWMRTRIEKLIEFLQTDFRGFLSQVRGPIPVNTKLSAFVGSGHSFWHDNIVDPDVQTKLQRRIDRFLQLDQSSRQMLFVRALATSCELAQADELYAELLKLFGSHGAQVYLLVIVCQQQLLDPIRSQQSQGLLIYPLGREAHGADMGDPAPFCEPISWALRYIQKQGSTQPRPVASAKSLLENGTIVPNAIGLDGMEGVPSFEASEADKAAFAAGARVEAWYRGTWYPATVMRAPDDGCDWKVQCDFDPPGNDETLTTHRLRKIQTGAEQASSSNT